MDLTKNKKKRLLSPSTKLFLAILPSIIICFLYCYRPLSGLLYAFFEYKPKVSVWQSEFVGLKYFEMLVSNPIKRRDFVRVVRNTIVMSSIGVLTSYLPMLTTILLNEIRSTKYKRTVQTIITIPNFISWIIVYAAFFNILAPNSGLISVYLQKWGIIEGSFDLMISAEWGYFFMWILGQWKGLGWSTIVYFSALSSADQELYDAAAVDGANRFQKMWHISVPHLMPTYITLLIMSIGSFFGSDFERAFVFSNAFNRATVETLDLYVYNIGLVGAEFSLGTAVGLAKSIIGIILMIFSNYLAKKVRGASIF